MTTPARFIIFALTNPEPEYANTRHNIGNRVVRALAAQLGASFTNHRTPNQVAQTQTTPGAKGIPLTLVIPHGYMNTHGNGAQAIVRFTDIPTDHLIVVHDEMDFDTGILRLKRGGTGGHNGLKSIKQRLNADDFIRLRVGIGRPPGRMDPAKYVLQRFSKSEQASMDVTVMEAVDVLLDVVTRGYDAAQQRLHTP